MNEGTFKWALNTVRNTYFTLDNIEFIKRQISRNRLMLVRDDNGKSLYLNPTAIVTIQRVDE